MMATFDADSRPLLPRTSLRSAGDGGVTPGWLVPAAAAAAAAACADAR